MSEDTISRPEKRHKDDKAKNSKKRKADPAGEVERTSEKNVKEGSAAAKADRKKVKKQKRNHNTSGVAEGAPASNESHLPEADEREERRKHKKERKAKRNSEKERRKLDEGKDLIKAGAGTESYGPPNATTNEAQDAVAEVSKAQKSKGPDTEPSQKTSEVEQVGEKQGWIDLVETTTDNPEEKDAKEKTIENVEAGKASRFIVFIGNLPFTATTEKIAEHFKAIKPASIRHMTEKASSKSKGFAFLEFDHYDRMKSCLKLYHHSKFDDGKKKPPRKINVELTAGGGGKNNKRMEKLRIKNERLTEQRRRKMEVSAKQMERRAAKNAEGEDQDGEKEVVAEEKDDQSGMHPSRRAQLQKY